MIVQRTEPALGVGRRLRTLPQPSCPPGGGFTHSDSCNSQTSTSYMSMRYNCSKLKATGAFAKCIEPPSTCFPEAYLRSSNRRISINYDALNEWEFLNSPRECPDIIHQSLLKGSPPGSPRNAAYRIHFHNQRIVPSLIRLVDDLTGKEAGREANIGDKQNVTKYIN